MRFLLPALTVRAGAVRTLAVPLALALAVAVPLALALAVADARP